MNLRNKILELISIVKSRDINDPRSDIEMDKVTVLLLQNVDETIKFLDGADKDDLGWVCSDFEELSYKFQSEKFVQCLKRLDQKFPKYMTSEIQNGIEAYYGDKEEA